MRDVTWVSVYEVVTYVVVRHDRSPYVNQSLFAPEWIYGMMSPTAPLKNRQLIWHLYSAQAYGIFHGDLDFYFGGAFHYYTPHRFA